MVMAARPHGSHLMRNGLIGKIYNKYVNGIVSVYFTESVLLQQEEP